MYRGGSGEELDEILALQAAVSWAGEGLCSPPRLAWWRTDLLDEAGGGDLFSRLVPRTEKWAALEAVREAARRTDEHARQGIAEPERLRTLFFFGFLVDERLSERLLELKRSGKTPEGALPGPLLAGAVFDADSFATALRSLDGAAAYSAVPGGRELRGPLPSDLRAVARRLAAALVPFTPVYPMPFSRFRS